MPPARKCVFNEGWVEDEPFKVWVTPVNADKYAFYCRVCKKTRSLGNMGKNALFAHAEGQRHRELMRQQKSKITSFVMTEGGTGSDRPTATTSKNVTMTVSDIATNSMDVLKAELLWTLQTAATHSSYNSNSNIEDYFRTMFSDSAIAKLFSCGADKTAYLLRFGLAPYFLKQLINNIGTDSFVLMFDESLNQKTKLKQMDVHVRFWSSDVKAEPDNKLVKTHYLGSAFLGHATAVDMVSHFNVSILIYNHLHVSTFP